MGSTEGPETENCQISHEVRGSIGGVSPGRSGLWPCLPCVQNNPRLAQNRAVWPAVSLGLDGVHQAKTKTRMPTGTNAHLKTASKDRECSIAVDQQWFSLSGSGTWETPGECGCIRAVDQLRATTATEHN